MSYIITSGWWCAESDKEQEKRQILMGSDSIRGSNFHKIWAKSILQNTNPTAVYIVDSASPVKPAVENAKIQIFSLSENPGHSTWTSHKYCGFTASNIVGMTLAISNDVDYWVFVEQDAVLKGEGIVEFCISKMNRPYMFGSGQGTPQPLQQSFMIIKTTHITKFLHYLDKIASSDREVSPEVKYAYAASPIARLLVPCFTLKLTTKKDLLSRLFSKLYIMPILSFCRGFDYLPVGFGRARPIDFSDKFFYFQHGDDAELQKYYEQI